MPYLLISYPLFSNSPFLNSYYSVHISLHLSLPIVADTMTTARVDRRVCGRDYWRLAFTFQWALHCVLKRKEFIY
jgi:hypothetical protein